VGVASWNTLGNPTGWAMLLNAEVSACHLFRDEEIIKEILGCNLALTAIDAL